MNLPRLPPGTPETRPPDRTGVPRRSSDTNALDRPNENSKVNDILSKLEVEHKIKEGAENLLQVFDTRKLKEGKEAYKQQVESQLDAANAKIQLLQLQLHEYGLTRSTLDVSQAVETGADEQIPAEQSPTWSLGDILQSLEVAAEQSTEYLVTRANDLVTLLQRHPLLKYDLAMSRVGDRIRTLLLHERSEVVAAGYRVARYAITDLESLQNIRGLYTDFMVIRTLTKDSKAQVERIQALKFIRTFLDVPQGVEEISIGVIRALVAAAEQSDDRLKNIAIETLAEILVQDPKDVADGGGVRVLLQCVVEGPYELSSPVAMALTYILDSPKNRHLLREGKDLEYLASAFTDFQTKGHVHTERLVNSSKVLSSVLRSWPGLYAFSIDRFSTLKSVVGCLRVDLPALRDILLDFFFTLFRIRSLSWSSSYLAGRRLTSFGRVDLKQENNRRGEPDCRFVDHFTALLLHIFISECGLVSVLCQILEGDSDPSTTRKSLLLLSEILSLAERLLPRAEVQKIVLLPELFRSAAQLTTPENAKASSALLQIDKISLNLHKTEVPAGVSKRTEDTMSNQVKVKMGVQMDDASFKQLILDTNVLTTKNHTKWNWNALSELIEGPLLNPRRLDEAIKTTKFMKRLMSFYRPFKYRFSSVKRTKPNQKYVEVGSSLLNTMLATPEGVKYLTENKLLRQIAECLAQLDPMSGITSPEPLFSSQRLQSTLSYGYFTLLGTLSADPNGMLMMERWRMFNMFYHLSELSSRDDLITNFIASMDYRLPGHPRIILSKALTTAQKDVRLYATEYLRNLLHSTQTTQQWAIGLLVTQLYDPELDICRMAVEVLQEFCEHSPQNLEHFVRLQPYLGHLGDIGSPLLLRFLSTSIGFKYLKELDYVHTEMDNWFHGQTETFVMQIEEYLESSQANWVPGSASSLEFHAPGIMPRHFYGELTLTEEGCQLLQNKGHFTSFANYIKQHRYECKDNEIVLKLKGSLWAVGNIGANPLGAPFLEDCGVVEDIMEIATQSQVCSLKGTAFFALGLISSVFEGLEILDELGWDSCIDVMGEPRGSCLPRDLYTVFNHPASSSLSGEVMEQEKEQEGEQELQEEVEFPELETDPVKRKIITALCNLSNQILANDASRQLVRLETRYRSKFQSVDLYLEVMKLLAKYRYKLPVRRFIFELFDTGAMIEKLARRQREQQRRSRHLSDTK